MGHDRYDTRQGSRGEQGRWNNERHDGRGRSEGRGEGGFFERAGNEIASWFGDDDRSGQERRERSSGGRDYGQERGERGWSGGRDQERGRSESRDHDDDRNWFGGHGRDEERGYSGSQGRMSGGGDRFGPSMAQDGGYRPMTGDYGRSERFSGGADREHDSRGLGGSQRGQSNWDRDDYRRTSFAGSREQSQHHDPHYQQWRERQMQELDRDYHDYHSERQTHFENDFGSWRERKQQKRQTIGRASEHMEVVGSDGQRVGTVDKIAGDRLILTKSDPEAGGVHHSLSCNHVDRIEDNRVILECTAEQAKQRWSNEDHSRALFERENQGQSGPHVLDRSFSGTYRD